MAMNKKEKAEFDAAIERAELLAALRWTEQVAKDLPPPLNSSSSDTSGWDFNSYSKTVGPCWSSCVSHGSGATKTQGSASQQSLTLFSTKLRALQALRHEVEKNAAKDLLRIDKLIAAERLI